MPRALLRERCALTAPFHPYRNSRTSQAPQACACFAFASGSKADRLSPFTSVRGFRNGLRLLHPRVRFEQNGSHRSLTRPAAVYFLWHFPSSHFSAAPKRATKAPSRTLSGTLLCGVRTFLSLGRAARGNPASTTQTATIRSDISYPYYKMNSGRKGPMPCRGCAQKLHLPLIYTDKR